MYFEDVLNAKNAVKSLYRGYKTNPTVVQALTVEIDEGTYHLVRHGLTVSSGDQTRTATNTWNLKSAIVEVMEAVIPDLKVANYIHKVVDALSKDKSFTKYDYFMRVVTICERNILIGSSGYTPRFIQFPEEGEMPFHTSASSKFNWIAELTEKITIHTLRKNENEQYLITG